MLQLYIRCSCFVFLCKFVLDRFIWFVCCMFFVLLVYDVFFDGVMHKIYHGSQILVTTNHRRV